MQEIFTRASKVMVDTKSNNNMLYLPLDKIMHLAAQDAAKSAAAAGSASSSLVNPPSQPPLRAAPCRPRHLPAAAIATRCLATVRRVNPEDH